MEAILRSNTQRIRSVDILRGAIMVIMALDHVRDFYTNVPFDPLDLSKTTPLLFFTRWITHFCAPVFIFLSGVSAQLSLSKKNSKAQAALFLLKRGLWLILLEFTVIGFGWLLDIHFHMLFAQVIWAIGCSMVFLALLLFINLKPAAIGAIGLLLIFGHNAFDSFKAADMGDYKFAWLILHEQGLYQINDYFATYILYPLVPWIGVMATGYYFGMLFKLEPPIRHSLFLKIGLGSLALFLLLRAFNIYGDPFPWQVQNAWWKNILVFVKCHKYPPSLLYLLMTIGVAIIALAFLDKVENKITRIFTVYGRVPFFYYICHIYLIHISQIIVALSLGFTEQDLEKAFQGDMGKWGFNLWVVYLIWLSVVAILYLPCRWFMKIKMQRKDWWLSYL